MRRREKNASILCRVILIAFFLSAGTAGFVHGAEAQTLSLDQCLSVAMERNHARPASSFAVVVAEAQHRQALSGYWPQFTLKAGFLRTDQPPNFIFPASNIHLPASSFQTGATSITIPANAFGPGFPPQNVNIPVPPQSVNVAAQDLPISQQEIKLMDEDSLFASMNAKWLLWTAACARVSGDSPRRGSTWPARTCAAPSSRSSTA